VNKKLIILFSIFISLTVSGQGKLKIKGCIKELPFNKVYLAEIVGGHQTYIDSAMVYNGCFDFYVSDTIASGMYSIVLSKERNSFIRILLNNKEDVIFYTVFNKLLDSLRFSSQGENSIYYSYLKKNAMIAEKAGLLKRLMAISADNPALVKNLKQELAANAIAGDQFGEQLTKKYPKSIAIAFIHSLIPIKIPANTDTASFILNHFLDPVDFGNMALHRSDVLASAILNYLSYTESPGNMSGLSFVHF